ncbi:hypothetical protein Tco_1476286 [Tanacetum coccineum]
MAQQVIPAAQLVPRLYTIGRCNNYVVLQSIPCSPECKIVGQILLHHPLSYALTATIDVPVVYLQQFWRTVSKVPGPEDTIKFMLNTQEFIYTVDMFRDILHFPMETPDNPFVAPVNIGTIEDFMNMVGYQDMVDKKFLDIPQKIEEDYHSIKDDIPLVSVYTTGNVLVRGMLIPDAFLTEEIRATDDFKEYETVFMNVDVPINQPQLVVSTQGMHRSTPRAHRTPTLTASPQGKKRKERDAIAKATLLSLALHKTALAAEAQENVAKVQEKLDEEEIEKMVEGEEDEESYASALADSVFNDDVDDCGTKIEPESHKEHPKHVTDDDEDIEKEKKDEEIEKENKDEEIEKEKEDVEIVKVKDIADDGTSSKETRKEQKRTPIPSPTRSPRNVSSSDKTVSEELTATISPTTATTSKDSSITKCKKRSFSHMTKTLPVNKDREVDPINAKEMIAKEFANHGPKMIEELFLKHMQNTTLNLYPTTSTSTAGNSSADLQHQLYLNKKSKPQDQATDPEI